MRRGTCRRQAGYLTRLVSEEALRGTAAHRGEENRHSRARPGSRTMRLPGDAHARRDGPDDGTNPAATSNSQRCLPSTSRPPLRPRRRPPARSPRRSCCARRWATAGQPRCSATTGYGLTPAPGRQAMTCSVLPGWQGGASGAALVDAAATLARLPSLSPSASRGAATRAGCWTGAAGAVGATFMDGGGTLDRVRAGAAPCRPVQGLSADLA